jgi:PAP2 superfamily
MSLLEICRDLVFGSSLIRGSRARGGVVPRGDAHAVPDDATDRSFSAPREAAVGAATYVVYQLVRKAAVTPRGYRAAMHNARRVVAFERRLGVHVEPTLQRLLLARPRTTIIANTSYVTLNVGLTVGWMALLHARRDVAYHRLRRALLLATLGAQPIYLLLPTAPPRMLDGFRDTIRESGWDLDTGVVSTLYDPIAAMPSIHVAFAVLIGEGMRERARSPVVRWIAPAYAPAVAGMVLATANHYLLDVVAGALLAYASRAAARRIGPADVC